MSNVNEIRSTATDQFLLIATRCSGEQHPIRFFITLLFTQVSLIDIYLEKIIKFNKTYFVKLKCRKILKIDFLLTNGLAEEVYVAASAFGILLP